MASIGLERAERIIAGALAHAAEKRFKPLAVVVLDAGGHPVALARQDGASLLRPQVATGKAAGALGLGVSSRRIAEMAAERPQFVASLGPLAPHGVVPAAGGVLVLGPDGALLGAVGASGDLSDNDEACVLAGIAAAGLAAGA